MYYPRFVTGDYGARQKAANEMGAVCYLEQHFNASPSPSTNYCCVIVADNASSTSKAWAATYAALIHLHTGIEPYAGSQTGTVVGGFEGRGNANLRSTNMPAILVEPLFCTNKEYANGLHPTVEQVLASAIVQSITAAFPQGGIVALSIGHKGKDSNPNDRGAQCINGETEADWAERVLVKAAEILSHAQ